VANRFKHTFTKLRAFEIYKLDYTKRCFLDANMAVFQNPDPIFNTNLPGKDWLSATHDCICKLSRAPWASPDWNKGYSAYTHMTGPHRIAPEITSKCRPTYHLLNSGMFLYCPSEVLRTRVLDFFSTTDKLKDYRFPDLNFLADFFHGKWQSVLWKYNAVETMTYVHPYMWSDDEATVLHYIIDKPWDRQVISEGVAGYRVRDVGMH
jgi:inositol 3-alpha-galactosyltransferase